MIAADEEWDEESNEQKWKKFFLWKFFTWKMKNFAMKMRIFLLLFSFFVASFNEKTSQRNQESFFTFFFLLFHMFRIACTKILFFTFLCVAWKEFLEAFSLILLLFLQKKRIPPFLNNYTNFQKKISYQCFTYIFNIIFRIRTLYFS